MSLGKKPWGVRGGDVWMLCKTISGTADKPEQSQGLWEVGIVVTGQLEDSARKCSESYTGITSNGDKGNVAHFCLIVLGLDKYDILFFFFFSSLIFQWADFFCFIVFDTD